MEDYGYGYGYENEQFNMNKKTNKLTSNELIGVLFFLLCTCIILSLIAYFAFQVEKANDPNFSTQKFYGTNKEPGEVFKAIGVGMIKGMVFGFIDNAGLFFGMRALDPLFEKKFPDGKHTLVKAGLGNTFSDIVGNLSGIFISSMVTTSTKVSEHPFWAETLGLLVGCLVGLYLPWYSLKHFILPNPNPR